MPQMDRVHWAHLRLYVDKALDLAQANTFSLSHADGAPGTAARETVCHAL